MDLETIYDNPVSGEEKVERRAGDRENIQRPKPIGHATFQIPSTAKGINNTLWMNSVFSGKGSVA